MARRYTKLTNLKAKELLERLLDVDLSPTEYGAVMYNLGHTLGPILAEKVEAFSELTLACTVEDADHLAKGMIDFLESHNNRVYLNVFWNVRFKAGGISVAPIAKQYKDRDTKHTKTLVVIKSIISSSCVVRTNLTRLIEEFMPDEILVVAPVLLKGSIGSLESEFAKSISERFSYLFFAEDDVRTDDGIIIPGIGGDIYQKLGFDGQSQKNRFIPQIVKERRTKIKG